MKRLTICLAFLLLCFLSPAQIRLTVEGDAKIDGKIDIESTINSIFIGRNAGTSITSGQDNTFLGFSAGASNTTASRNTFVGFEAGLNNTASNNTFVGMQAGRSNSSGSSNTFIGWSAGGGNTSGFANTFLGVYAGIANTTGFNNVFVGRGAAQSNKTGSNNAFLGAFAGFKNTALGNVFVGDSTAFENTSGEYNTFVGKNAGTDNVSGSENTLLGYNAALGFDTLSNASAIGAYAQVDCEGCLVLGNSGVKVGIGISNPTTALDINGGLKLTGDATANRFLDANNTSFYADPASTSRFNENHVSLLRDRDNTTYYLDPANGGTSLNVLGQTIAARYTDANNQSFYADPAGLSLLNEVNSSIFRDLDNTSRFIDPSNTGTSMNVAGQTLATRYVDVSNQSFYADPASISQLSEVRTNIIRDLGNTTYFLDPANTGTSVSVAGQTIANRYTDANNQSFYVDPASTSILNQVNASLFRDSDNTSYFLDPANLGTAGRLQGTVSAQIFNDVANSSYFLDAANAATALNINGDAIKPGGGDWDAPSDKRLKKNVQPFEDGLEEVLQIRPVWFQYNGKAGIKNEKKHVGIIAQEMQKIAPYTINTFTQEENKNTQEYLSYNSTAVTYMLVNAIQEQQEVIERQESELNLLKNELTEIKTLLQNNTSVPLHNTLKSNESKAVLQQNQPNPFNDNTIISYFIPITVNQAQLQITDAQGKIIQTFEIGDRGNGQIEWNAQKWSGNYYYSLILDGEIVATKQMVISP